MVNQSERNKLCALVTDLCDKRLSGDDFFDKLLMSHAGDDSALEMVIEWLLDTWDPEWPRSRGFDAADPPYRIQRQMTLFRRFLLSGEPYKWPNDNFVDAFPMLRLWATGLTVSAVMVTLTISLHHHWLAPVAIACGALAGWLILREPAASERDSARAWNRASAYGDPKWWPFLNGKVYHAAGPSRSRRLGVPPTEPGGLIPLTDSDRIV